MMINQYNLKTYIFDKVLDDDLPKRFQVMIGLFELRIPFGFKSFDLQS